MQTPQIKCVYAIVAYCWYAAVMGDVFSSVVYLLCTVIDEGQLVNAAVVVSYVLTLLIGYLQQLVRDFLVLRCIYVFCYVSVCWSGTYFFDCGAAFIPFLWRVFGFAAN
jgi:hypothetical protein